MARRTRKVVGVLEAADTFQASTAAARDFAGQVASLPRVAAVLADPVGQALHVWTLLDGDWQGDARASVYERELEVRLRHPAALVRYRVLDVAEYPGSQRETLLPQGAVPLFVRPGVNLPVASAHGDAR